MNGEKHKERKLGRRQLCFEPGTGKEGKRSEAGQVVERVRESEGTGSLERKGGKRGRQETREERRGDSRKE